MRLRTDIIIATKEQIFEVLTDFNGYAEWMPDIAESTVLAQEGDIFVVEFSSPELMAEKYQLEVVCSKPTSIRYKQIGIFEETRKQSSGLSGSWEIIDSSDGKGTAITGEMNFKTNVKKANLILQRRLDTLQQMFALTTTSTEECKPFSALGAQMVEAFQAEEVAVWFLGSKYLYKKVH